MSRYLYILTILLAANQAGAQGFAGEARLSQVSADGFYRVTLTPEVSAYLSDGFHDIRIFDAQNKEVPFLMEEERPAYSFRTFNEYEILEKKQAPGCCTSVVLHNPARNSINNISLQIKNADVTKAATLLGSDDREHWFALKERFLLSGIENTSQTSEVKIVDFPLSNYRYYSLRMDDSTSAPLNILKAGYYAEFTAKGSYTRVPYLSLERSDSAKRTYIQITFDTTYIIDKVELSMKGTPYFLRNASLYTRRTRITKKGPREYDDLQQQFQLTSSHSTILSLPALKAKELSIVIENEDNPSLEVSSLETYQLNRYLVAWLQGGKDYTLRFGDATVGMPAYDLAFFRDSIPEHPAVVPLEAIRFIQQEEAAETSFTLFTSKNIIWIAVILIIVVLGFMSVRMLGDTVATDKEN
jgi:hypothetical protein